MCVPVYHQMHSPLLYLCLTMQQILLVHPIIIILLQQFTAIGMCNVHLLFNVQLTSKDTNRSTPLVFIKRPLCFKQTAINIWDVSIFPHISHSGLYPINNYIIINRMNDLFSQPHDYSVFSTFSICVIIFLTCPKCVFAAINQIHMQCTMHLNFVLFNRTSGLQSHRH